MVRVSYADVKRGWRTRARPAQNGRNSKHSPGGAVWFSRAVPPSGGGFFVCHAEREFPVLLMPTPRKKTQKIRTNKRGGKKRKKKARKHPQKIPKKNTPNFFFALTREKKLSRQKKTYFPSRQKRNETKRNPALQALCRKKNQFFSRRPADTR